VSVRVVTDLEVTEAFKAVVAEHGHDMIYSRDLEPGESIYCKYVVDGKPSCLVAHILHRLGVPLDYLAVREGVDATRVLGRCGPDAPVDVTGLNISVSVRAANALSAAQSSQDAGHCWGSALARYESWMVF